jgi:hypothetical protein
MDVQMEISVLAADTPSKIHNVPIVVSRMNISPLSHAKLRDQDLVNDLDQLATSHRLKLDTTFLTSELLYELLVYQLVVQPKGPAGDRVRNAIHHLEMAWEIDIRTWSRNEDFTPEDPNTGEVIWNTYSIQFIHLILQPLQTRSAYVFFDKKGDISGQFSSPGIWRRCRFMFFSLSHDWKTFELEFHINKQKKGLILQTDDIRNFDSSGIIFQHPMDPDSVLINPFSCDEFAQPRHDSYRLKRLILSHMKVSKSQERTPNSTEVFLQ